MSDLAVFRVYASVGYSEKFRVLKVLLIVVLFRYFTCIAIKKMNEVYFMCQTCKMYHGAGYRWCYSHLEKAGIVTKGKRISVDEVFRTAEYWDWGELTDENSLRLRDQLRQVAEFLEKHKTHEIIYNEDQSFMWKQGQYDWMDEEEDAGKADLSPRYFVERLGMTQWQDVVEYLNRKVYESRPFWFVFDDEMPDARRKFEELVNN